MSEASEAATESPDSASLSITVVYALSTGQFKVAIRLPPGATVSDAVERSGLTRRFPDLLRHPLVCATFGRIVELSAPLRAGDRVEILRPLLIDPKENRRRTALRARRKST